MKLTLEQIRSITVGAISVFEEDAKFHFRRFTDRQLEVWAQVSDHIRGNSYGTAGCRLSFYTDSRYMILGAGNGGKLWLKLGPEIPKAGSSVQNVNTGSAPTTPDATAKLPAGGK